MRFMFDLVFPLLTSFYLSMGFSWTQENVLVSLKNLYKSRLLRKAKSLGRLGECGNISIAGRFLERARSLSVFQPPAIFNPTCQATKTRAEDGANYTKSKSYATPGCVYCHLLLLDPLRWSLIYIHWMAVRHCILLVS